MIILAFAVVWTVYMLSSIVGGMYGRKPFFEYKAAVVMSSITGVLYLMLEFTNIPLNIEISSSVIKVGMIISLLLYIIAIGVRFSTFYVGNTSSWDRVNDVTGEEWVSVIGKFFVVLAVLFVGNPIILSGVLLADAIILTMVLKGTKDDVDYERYSRESRFPAKVFASTKTIYAMSLNTSVVCLAHYILVSLNQ